MPPLQQPQNTTRSILIVDDQAALCETLERFLRKRGYKATSSTNASDALERAAQEHFDLIITDVCMPDKSGLELLEEIKERGGEESVIMMTAFATVDQSVEAMRRGATDYITKPFQLNQVAHVIEQALNQRDERSQDKPTARGNGQNGSHLNGNGHGNGNGYGLAAMAATGPFNVPLIGRAPLMNQLFAIIDRIAQTDRSVLITGATGTGKELIARAIHEKSQRRHARFVDINCSTIPDTLFEAELFGHQRGTFTGAHETRRGLFEQASGGVLFLDEIDTLDRSSQAKLLRVLQERQLRRVGGRENIPIDVRVISATNRNLQAAVAEGSFRADLFFRLCVVPLHVPELHERSDDIKLLVEHFLLRHAEGRAGESPRRFSTEAMRALMAHRWPGNVRELENAVEYALAISDDEELGINDLPPNVVNGNSAKGNDVFKGCLLENAPLKEINRRYILATFERYGRNQIKTAAALGIDRRTLYRKLQQYGALDDAKEMSDELLQ